MSLFVRHLWIVLGNSRGVPVRNDFNSRGEALKDSTASVNQYLSSCFDVSLADEDDTFDSSSCLPWSSFGNVGVDFRAERLAFDISWPDATNPISLDFVGGEIFTSLNGFLIQSSPRIPFMSSSSSGRITCYGRAVVVCRLKLYCVTSEIALLVIMRCMVSSAPISISFTFRSWGTQLQ